MYTGNMFLLLICPSFSFFFLSNFQTLKCFVILLSGSVTPTHLKVGIDMDNDWMYGVHQNQAPAAYSLLYFFSFLRLQYSDIKDFHRTFS